MRFESSFDVGAPLDQVWNTVLDVERVAPTVPGAQVLERTGENAFKVAIKVKVGPMSMTYRGDVEITERDDAAHRAVMKARAKESRGQGTADADVTMVLSGGNGTTSATVTTDVELSGKVATMGQGVLQDVSGRLVQTFAKNLAAMLEDSGAAAAGEPGSGSEAVPARPGLQADAAPAAAGSATAGESFTPARAAAASPGAATSPPAGVSGSAPIQSPPPPAPAADALDLGSIGGAVIAGRLQEPRALGALLTVVAVLAFLLGRRSAR